MTFQEELQTFLNDYQANYTSSSALSSLLKTFQSHNITIQDWNTLVNHLVGVTEREDALKVIVAHLKNYVDDVARALSEEIDEKITVYSVQIEGTPGEIESTNSTVQTEHVESTLSLADEYGDNKNPYGSKLANQVLASPEDESGIPTFRNLTQDDIPLLNGDSKIHIPQGIPGNITEITDEGHLTDSGLSADELALAEDVPPVSSSDFEIILTNSLGKWNAAVGMAITALPTNPYAYAKGDYFYVAVAGKRAPTGAYYDENTQNSTATQGTIEIETVFYFDGTSWINRGVMLSGTVSDVQVDGESVVDLGIAKINGLSFLRIDKVVNNEGTLTLQDITNIGKGAIYKLTQGTITFYPGQWYSNSEFIVNLKYCGIYQTSSGEIGNYSINMSNKLTLIKNIDSYYSKFYNVDYINGHNYPKDWWTTQTSTRGPLQVIFKDASNNECEILKINVDGIFLGDWLLNQTNHNNFSIGTDTNRIPRIYGISIAARQLETTSFTCYSSARFVDDVDIESGILTISKYSTVPTGQTQKETVITSENISTTNVNASTVNASNITVAKLNKNASGGGLILPSTTNFGNASKTLATTDDITLYSHNLKFYIEWEYATDVPNSGWTVYSFVGLMYLSIISKKNTSFTQQELLNYLGGTGGAKPVRACSGILVNEDLGAYTILSCKGNSTGIFIEMNYKLPGSDSRLPVTIDSASISVSLSDFTDDVDKIE